MFFPMKDLFADISHRSAYFGLGTGSIHVNHLQCNSREHRLLDCGYDNVTDRHHEDWGVSCRNGNNSFYYLLLQGFKMYHIYYIVAEVYVMIHNIIIYSAWGVLSLIYYASESCGA